MMHVPGPLFALVTIAVLPEGIPASPIYLLAFWAGALVSLCIAVLALNVFTNVIETDSEFMSLKKELILAIVVSGIEATGVWLLAAYVPAASGRGIFLPLIVAGLLYQIAHYDSWGRFEMPLLLIFQFVIVVASVSFFLGYYQAAFFTVAVCILLVWIFAAIARNL